MEEETVVSMREKYANEKTKIPLAEEIISWLRLIGTTLVVVIIINIVVPRTEVQGSSMYPTLADGDRLIVWQLFYAPNFQDIVVLEHTNGDLHVKRVLGIAGDVVNYINGEMFVNGELITEPYIASGASHNGFLFENLCQITHDLADCSVIPVGYFLVLGDNRNNSGDSRGYGLVHESQIIGRVMLRFSPFSKFGVIR